MTDPKLVGVSVRYDIQPPVLECERCLKTEVLILPMPISRFLEVSADFGQKHNGCEEKTE